MTNSQINTLIQRLDRLEQKNRFWKRVALLFLVIMVPAILMGQALPNRRVVEAEKFILKDTDGRVRGVLGAESPGLPPKGLAISIIGQYGLHLYASDGSHGVSLAELHGGGGWQLALRGKDTPSYAILAGMDGLAFLQLAATEQTREAEEHEHEEWREKFNAATTPEERKRLFFTKPFHGVTAEFSTSSKGLSSLELVRGSSLHSRGGMKFYLLEGQPTLRLMDEKGTARAVLGHTKLERKATEVVEQRPTSSLVLFDKNGKVIWQVP